MNRDLTPIEGVEDFDSARELAQNTSAARIEALPLTAEAVCIIPNCGKRAPAAEPFCAAHRDKNSCGHGTENGCGSPRRTEPPAVLRQRANDDCTICCIAMATGLSYDAVMTRAKVSLGGYRYGGTPGTMSPKGVLIDLGFAAKRLGCGGDSQGAGARNALWGRRAILSVPSLNGFTGHHDVYWDGSRVWDPSPKERYPEKLPATIHWATVMDETAREHSSPQQVPQPIREAK